MKEEYKEKDNAWFIVSVCLVAVILFVVLLKKNEDPKPEVFGNFTSVLVDTQRGYEYHKDVNANICFLTTKAGVPMKVSCEEIKYYFPIAYGTNSDKLNKLIQKNVDNAQKSAERVIKIDDDPTLIPGGRK